MNALSHGWSLESPTTERRGPIRYLQLVTGRRSQAPRAPFVLVVMAILIAGLLSLLALNTVLNQDAFRLHQLQLDGRALSDREQALAREVSDLQSPHSLASRATSLGMVPGGSPAFLRLSDGKVLGRSEPAVATPPLAAAAPAAPPAVGVGQTAKAPAGQGAAAQARRTQGKPAKASTSAKAEPADGGWTVVRPGSKQPRR